MSQGDMARIGAQAGVPKSVKEGMTVIGTPAMEGKDGLRALSLIERLPEMKRALAALEKRLAKLEKA